tara:strand:- start:2029 stop:2214 length:186 start_codon:yes stop_codon:yes gene_type:complete
MTSLELRAIEKARSEYKRARKELQRVRISETAYRGVPYCTDAISGNKPHSNCVYRGVSYIN